MPESLKNLYCCMLIAPAESEQVINFLQGAALGGMTPIPYRLWTLEAGVFCLAIALNAHEPAHSPEYRTAACFQPVAPAAVKRTLLMVGQAHADTLRQLACTRGITLPADLVLYVSEEPGETILSLKCEDDSPSWDQRVRLARLVKDMGWAWQATNLHHPQNGAPAVYPKFAWKHVAPPAPVLLLAALRTADRARAGHILAVVLEDGTEALGWVERPDGCDQGQDLVRVVWLRPTGKYVRAWYTGHLLVAYPYESTLPAIPDPDFIWHGLKRFGAFRILALQEVRSLCLKQAHGPARGVMQRSIAHAYGCDEDALSCPAT